MSGEPINEPLIHNKTFVMNTQEEIKQAFQDFED
jgi:redox-sensitive bicupin YhaK (pirin superfamily)